MHFASHERFFLVSGTLFAFFIVYVVVDRTVNTSTEEEEALSDSAVRGIILIVFGLLGEELCWESFGGGRGVHRAFSQCSSVGFWMDFGYNDNSSGNDPFFCSVQSRAAFFQ